MYLKTCLGDNTDGAKFKLQRNTNADKKMEKYKRIIGDAYFDVNIDKKSAKEPYRIRK